VGTGYDIHKLVSGRKLILGGVDIPYSKGLLGHSDADVVIHAIGDALLGAAGERDIGFYFPNTDKKWLDISSLKILGHIKEMLNKKNLKIGNIDVMIIMEEPKIKNYIDKMKDNIAHVLKCPKENIGIKATTSEGLGVIGRKEGIAAQAVCLIKQITEDRSRKTE
jgi:2-C-methyl-D-erythritol 2,4-cyclodiphosphate synthase